MEAVSPVDGVQLTALPDFATALERARAVPGNLADLPAHVETATAGLAAAADLLHVEASECADELEDAWAPTAHAISAWVDRETDARKDDERLQRVKAAVTWLRTCANTLRERRMAVP